MARRRPADFELLLKLVCVLLDGAREAIAIAKHLVSAGEEVELCS